jgi:Transposase DDE domain
MTPCAASDVMELRQQALDLLCPHYLAQMGRELGLEWRETPLALPNLVALFARQVARGNCSIPELLRDAQLRVTPEAYCTARMHLPPEVLQHLLRRLSARAEGYLLGQAPLRWNGHRLWHLDGSSFSMPDTPALQARFGQSAQQAPGCGFPTAHLLCLFEVASGMIRQAIVSPLATHDMAHAVEIAASLQAGDLLIGDCAFENYAHLALLSGRGIDLLSPIHQRRQVDLRRRHRRAGQGHLRDAVVVGVCGQQDCLVRLRKPQERPEWMSPKQFAALPQSLVVRVLRRRVRLPGGKRQLLTVVTTLRDPLLYPAKDLLRLLKGRWAVETNLRHLKTTMKMDILRSTTPEGIEKELTMFLILYNAVRVVILEAASKQQVRVDRISFADALYWVRHGDLKRPLPKLQVVPYRPDRVEPRAVKRRPKEYDRLNKPRDQMRKRLLGRT